MKLLDLKEEKWKKRFTYEKVVGFDGLIGESKFQVIRFKANRFIKPHHHKKTVEIFILKSGKGSLYVGGIKYPFRKDEFYLIQPHDVHGIVAQTDLEIIIFKPYEKKNDIYWDC